MSRIGRMPINIPEGVTVNLNGRQVVVVGPRGELKLSVRPEIEIKIKENQIFVSRINDDKISRCLHGLIRTLIANMIEGVTKGWEKTLKLVGTGYRVKAEGENLIFSLGFSHPVEVKPKAGIKFEVKDNDSVVISGNDKALVGLVAAEIRKIRPPEPYKGKGIKYDGEIVRRKPGKAAKVGTGFGA